MLDSLLTALVIVTSLAVAVHLIRPRAAKEISSCGGCSESSCHQEVLDV